MLIDLNNFSSLYASFPLNGHIHITEEELLHFMIYLCVSDKDAPSSWVLEDQLIFLKILFDAECFAKFVSFCPLIVMLLENNVAPETVLNPLQLQEFLQKNPLINIELDLCKLKWQIDLQKVKYYIFKENNNFIKIDINALYAIFKSNWSLYDNFLDHMYKRPVVTFDYFVNFINQKFDIGYSWSNYSNFQLLHLKILNELQNNNNIIINDLNNIFNKKK